MYRWFCVSDGVDEHGARVLSLSRFCIRCLDRSFDVSRVISHLVTLWMQVGIQGITLRGLARIRLPNHYSDNSSPVFVFTYFLWKELCLCVAHIVYELKCMWMHDWVCACVLVDSNPIVSEFWVCQRVELRVGVNMASTTTTMRIKTTTPHANYCDKVDTLTLCVRLTRPTDLSLCEFVHTLFFEGIDRMIEQLWLVPWYQTCEIPWHNLMHCSRLPHVSLGAVLVFFAVKCLILGQHLSFFF